VGGWRVIFAVHEESKTVNIVAIDRRETRFITGSDHQTSIGDRGSPTMNTTVSLGTAG
jgi:hypothetical protein